MKQHKKHVKNTKHTKNIENNSIKHDKHDKNYLIITDFIGENKISLQNILHPNL